MTDLSTWCSLAKCDDITIRFRIISLIKYYCLSSVTTVTMKVNNEWKWFVRCISGWNIVVEETFAFRSTEIDRTIHATDNNIIGIIL